VRPSTRRAIFARPSGLVNILKSRLEQTNFMQEIGFKEKRKNFKELLPINFKGATGEVNKKLLSVARLRHQKKQFLNC